MEYSFFIIKPAAMAMADDIMHDLEFQHGIKITTTKKVCLTDEMIKKIYPQISGLLLSIIIEKDADQPCLFAKVEGENIIQRLFDACGQAANPLLCSMGTIRNIYGNMDNFFKVGEHMFYGNIIHRPRNLKEVLRDEKIWNIFPE